MKKFSVLEAVMNDRKADSVAECTNVNEETYAYLWNEIQKTESGNVFLWPIWNTIPKKIQVDIFESLAKPIQIHGFTHDVNNRVKLVAYIDDELDFTFGYILKVQIDGIVNSFEFEDKSTAHIEYFKAQKTLTVLKA